MMSSCHDIAPAERRGRIVYQEDEGALMPPFPSSTSSPQPAGTYRVHTTGYARRATDGQGNVVTEVVQKRTSRVVERSASTSSTSLMDHVHQAAARQISKDEPMRHTRRSNVVGGQEHVDGNSENNQQQSILQPPFLEAAPAPGAGPFRFIPSGRKPNYVQPSTSSNTKTIQHGVVPDEGLRTPTHTRTTAARSAGTTAPLSAGKSFTRPTSPLSGGKLLYPRTPLSAGKIGLGGFQLGPGPQMPRSMSVQNLGTRNAAASTASCSSTRANYVGVGSNNSSVDSAGTPSTARMWSTRRTTLGLLPLYANFQAPGAVRKVATSASQQAVGGGSSSSRSTGRNNIANST
ncbi:unnamed protein product [Amoebophrya sp. A25]|nr:unnamed protein product [Amoebophrya sp. A25]|eukprot:GSA25T00026420001.1